MKKEFIVHLVFLAAFFLLISVFKNGFNSNLYLTYRYLAFWVGGIIGTLLVYSDHFIYAYFLKPQDSSSKNIRELFRNKRYKDAIEYMIGKHERIEGLIFHNARFHLIFILFSMYIVTSSGNTLGIGLVLGFLLHLTLDMTRDIVEKRGIEKWFKEFPLDLDVKGMKTYVLLSVLILLYFGIVL